jgi:hypothetical protein
MKLIDNFVYLTASIVIGLISYLLGLTPDSVFITGIIAYCYLCINHELYEVKKWIMKK